MIIIAGVPKSGKTTLSNSDQFKHLNVFHTDDLSKYEWSKQSEIACCMMYEKEYGILEGVIMVRALRKWLEKNKENPADKIIWMPNPKIELSRAQSNMANGCVTIWNSIFPKLRKTGVEIEEL